MAYDVHVTRRRIFATIIDGLIFGVLGSLLAVLFGSDSADSGFKNTTLATGGNLTLLIIVALYYVLMEGLLGRTVGKMVTGIRVVGADGASPPGILSAVIRTVLRVIDGIFAYLVGFIIVVSSDRRRRLGDIAAKTQVVRA